MDQSDEVEKVKREYHKWQYINLDDFTSTSCGSGMSYFWLWFLAIISVLVLAADSYTAVVLLAFNHWPGKVEPAVPFSLVRWIFALCILFSFILLGYEWFRAIRVMKKDSVAKDYLDPLAAKFQSMRIGTGRGFNRFMVFAALTKSRKGADYLAIFTYFQFKSAIRVLVAEGPRQAINAMTLYAFAKANLLNNGNSGGTVSAAQFWSNVEVLGEQSSEHAIILFTMLFTFVIWVFSILSFLAAVLVYITFLWHYIPRSDGGVTGYCRRKIEKRLQRIVVTKMKDAIDKAERRRKKDEVNAMKFGRPMPPPVKTPTLPAFLKDDDAMSVSSSVTRAPTANLAPPSRSGTPVSRTDSMQPLKHQPTLPLVASLPALDGNPKRPAGPQRSDTQTSGVSTLSGMSVSSDRPLLASDDRVSSPVDRRPQQYQAGPSLPNVSDRFEDASPVSAASPIGYAPPSRFATPLNRGPPRPAPQPYGNSTMPGGGFPPQGPPQGPPPRSMTAQPQMNYGRLPPPRSNTGPMPFHPGMQPPPRSMSAAPPNTGGGPPPMAYGRRPGPPFGPPSGPPMVQTPQGPAYEMQPPRALTPGVNPGGPPIPSQGPPASSLPPPRPSTAIPGPLMAGPRRPGW